MKIIQKRKIPFAISGILFIVSVVLLFTLGLKPGIDFTGGTLMEISFTGERPEVEEIQTSLSNLDLGNTTIQPAGENGYIIKMRFISEEEHQNILSFLRNDFETGGPGGLVISGDGAEGIELVAEEVQDQDNEETITDGSSEENSEEEKENKVLEERVETIGSSISAHLRERAWEAAIAVILAIVIFVAYAFRKVSRPVKSWKYGLTAIFALIHDVTITMGAFALLGHFFGTEVNIPFLVALLTIMGYSVNDTIVVFDRVRENLIKYGYDNFEEIVNKGVNETLVRSVNTSLTTLLVLLALYLFGGESIKDFSLALIIGIGFGTYSSVFLASPLLVVWERLGRK